MVTTDVRSKACGNAVLDPPHVVTATLYCIGMGDGQSASSSGRDHEAGWGYCYGRDCYAKQLYPEVCRVRARLGSRSFFLCDTCSFGRALSISGGHGPQYRGFPSRRSLKTERRSSSVDNNPRVTTSACLHILVLDVREIVAKMSKKNRSRTKRYLIRSGLRHGPAMG